MWQPGSHSLEEVRSGYVDQVQADVLQLAGNFLLQTREATVSVLAPQRQAQEREVRRAEGGPGHLPTAAGLGCPNSRFQVRREARAPGSCPLRARQQLQVHSQRVGLG